MTDSLKEQLLKLGFKTPPREERKPDPRPQHARPHGQGRPPHARGPGAGKPADGASRPARSADAGRPAQQRDARAPNRERARSQGDIDLAKAYAIRSQREKDERIAAEKLKQEEAARRREGKVKLIELLKTAALNVADADIARHFEYGGKIRRIYVTADQLKLLNVGDLAVVQQGGRYTLTSVDNAKLAESLLPGALALLVDPNAPAPEIDYADPQYQVPDDLVW